MLGLPPGPKTRPKMSRPLTLDDRIAALAASDRRYAVDAYHFVFRALDFVVEVEADDDGAVETDAHISSLRLLEGLRDYALELYGPLARLVLERWGIFRTEDFGEIVFRLVECRLLNKQESDRKSDFRNGFNFREAFDNARVPVAKSVE